MSKERVQEFFAAVEKDENLKDQFSAVIQEIQAELVKFESQDERDRIFGEKLIELGKKSGFEFNLHDLKEARQELLDQTSENGELAEEDLRAVAGGLRPITRKDMGLVYSIATPLGIGCIIASIGAPMLDKRETCGGYLSTEGDKCNKPV